MSRVFLCVREKYLSCCFIIFISDEYLFYIFFKSNGKEYLSCVIFIFISCFYFYVLITIFFSFNFLIFMAQFHDQHV